jgi:hypothetical protein
MKYREAVAVAWALEYEQADLCSKGPPEEFSNGFRPQAWADARNERFQRVSADIAVVYDEPTSSQLYGFALIGGTPLRDEFEDADQAEAWLAGVMREYRLNC